MRTLILVATFCLLLFPVARAGEFAQTKEQFRRHEALWKATAPKHYSLRVRHSAFSSEDGCLVQVFHVKNGRSTAEPAKGCETRPRKFGSVPALFEMAREKLAKRPDEVSVEFDPTYGYPKKFYVGSSTLEDNYFQFEVLDFRVQETQGSSVP